MNTETQIVLWRVKRKHWRDAGVKQEDRVWSQWRQFPVKEAMKIVAQQQHPVIDPIFEFKLA